ncbi:hypothetical protein BD410DRAFT_778145 [Rickenella mellea]|uniref:protein-tyrosine-phosphatase n=1 Tax=Rickenella mellea TaxID=50990 RepID=A0A4Y7PLQ2_9AGAM|nr:hypothetical protein BD410DRAFT_778145 [Rickenella mellea]
MAGPPSTTSLASKRHHPPKLSLGIDDGASNLRATTVIDRGPSPIEVLDDPDDPLSSPVSSSTSSSPLEYMPADSADTDSDAHSDDLSKDLAMLEKIRKNVQQNLRLRPIRSAKSGTFDATTSTRPLSPPSETLYDFRQQRSASPTSSASLSNAPSPSVYYTPTADLFTSPVSGHYTGRSFSLNLDSPASPDAPAILTSPLPARGLDPDVVFKRVAKSTRPLLIDTRQPNVYLSSRIQHSINIAIPSLIMRRCRKPGNGFPSLDTLRSYITTDQGKETWDEYMKAGGAWNGDLIVYDDEMDGKDRDNPQNLAWALLPLLAPLVTRGSVYYLKGGMFAARIHQNATRWMTSGEHERTGEIRSDHRSEVHPSPRKNGLFQLDTQTAARSKAMPEIEQPLTGSPKPSPVPSPRPMLRDVSPSPSPSSLVFPHHAQPRKPSNPNLRRIDTSSAERLIPKLSLRTIPIKSNTLAAPPLSQKSSSSSLRSHSPSHLNLSHPIHPPLSARHLGTFPNHSSDAGFLHPPSFPSSPNTPVTPTGFPPSPKTARPEQEQPPTTEEPLPVFSVSTILPNFLYLGPELTEQEHVEELQSLGVKRILNIAAECDDDQGLRLREKFERYTRIPMRDTVEEENVARSVREACEILDDARLHSAPTYVHCRAGKSRSVTAVIAYLIHANHWTLSRAYAFVVERRKGISPNIGFVSELMTYEEHELGGKSLGVVGNPASATGTGDGDDDTGKGGTFAYAVGGLGGRRAAHLRESLPPAFHPQNSEMMVPGQLSAGGIGPSTAANAARVGDSGQEMEIKDAFGRYRHARRAPVDEMTLQPMRRVSKAGLESSSYSIEV